MNGNIARMKELTPQLTAAFEKMVLRTSRTRIEVDTCVGKPIEAYGLVKNSEVAVVDAFCEAGSVMDWHTHGETEVMTVYVGAMVVEFDTGEVRTINVANTITIPPNKPHRVTFTEKSKVIAITIPPSAEFPDAE